ncbi:MAG: MotA/TolQ/ExbB proton channel family protein [Planctomycetales bacterium]|nr:MotA/TolQ/ExbB proton channel family protein [Planctomycetales bacterium]
MEGQPTTTPSQRCGAALRTLLLAGCALVLAWLAPVAVYAQNGAGPQVPVSQPGDPPVNVTDDGKADATGTIPTKNLLEALREGGLLMIPIAFCSFVLCVFVFERAISLRRGRVIPTPFVKRFVEQLEEGQLSREDALERCEQNGSAVAEVFSAAVRKWGRPSVEVEQAIIDAGERTTHNLRRYLRLLNGISTISPLLGLLGTVLGMIRAFNAIATADAMGRPELLATGISQALLTTAAGMTVAIPALIAYLFFTSRVDRLIIDIDRLGQQVVEQIASDGQRAEKKRAAKKAA